MKSNSTIDVKSSPSNRLVRGHFFLSIIAHTDVLWYKTGVFSSIFLTLPNHLIILFFFRLSDHFCNSNGPIRYPPL